MGRGRGGKLGHTGHLRYPELQEWVEQLGPCKTWDGERIKMGVGYLSPWARGSGLVNIDHSQRGWDGRGLPLHFLTGLRPLQAHGPPSSKSL